MLQSLMESSYLPLLEKMAVFGEKRQQVIAGNIANIDTPYYKTQDLDVAGFQDALKKAVSLKSGSSSGSDFGLPGLLSESMNSVQGGKSMSQLFPEELFQAADSASKNITFHDASNRSIEHEVMEMTKNKLQQGFVVGLMTAQMDLLQSVISERP
jgi:flagellar basal-body rod protein FlgB